MMYRLYYSVAGEGEWQPFRTTGEFWHSWKGFILTQNFAVFSNAEETVREWLGEPRSHYPVAIFQNNKNPVAIYDTATWPYVLESPDYCAVYRVEGGGVIFAEDPVVVV